MQYIFLYFLFFFQAEDGIRDLVRSRGLGDVYKRQQEFHVYKEIVLHSLADLDVLTKELTQGKIGFSDPLGKMLNELDLSLIHI